MSYTAPDAIDDIIEIVCTDCKYQNTCDPEEREDQIDLGSLVECIRILKNRRETK